VVAALADWSQLRGSKEAPAIARTRIGVIGTSDILANRNIDTLGNRQFLIELVQWVGFPDDVLSAARPPIGFSKVALTATDKSRLVRQGIVFPSIAVILPLPFVARRLRRG
jgi:hypothetical protein